MPRVTYWQCPVCGRNFARLHQFHNCELYSVSRHHLAKANPDTEGLYSLVLETVKTFGPLSIEPLKSMIAFKKNSQFCAIHVQTKKLKITFRNYTPLRSPRFHRTGEYQNVYYYEIYLTTRDEFDDEFISWLKLAYDEN